MAKAMTTTTIPMIAAERTVATTLVVAKAGTVTECVSDTKVEANTKDVGMWLL